MSVFKSSLQPGVSREKANFSSSGNQRILLLLCVLCLSVQLHNFYGKCNFTKVLLSNIV